MQVHDSHFLVADRLFDLFMCPICPSLYLGLWEQICIRWWRRWLQSLLRTRRQGVFGWLGVLGWSIELRRRLYLQNVSTGERSLASMALLSEVKTWATLDLRSIDSLGMSQRSSKDPYKLQRDRKTYGRGWGHLWLILVQKRNMSSNQRDMLVKPLVLASLCSANQYLNLFKSHTETAKMSSRLRISQH